MNAWNQFLWVIFPYLMIGIFIVGHLFQYNYDQLGWTAKSSEFLEKKTLKWGSILFHFGILFVFVGHVVGLLVPKQVTESLGITEEMYHMGAVYGGGLAGVATFIGIAILCYRRLTFRSIRQLSSISDIVIVLLLFIVIGNGILNIIGVNFISHEHFDYRETIAPWIRGLLVFSPDGSYMEGVPLGFQFHTFIAFLIIGLWPFTRLVHVWSVPVEYLKRSYIIYRSRNAKKSIGLRQ